MTLMVQIQNRLFDDGRIDCGGRNITRVQLKIVLNVNRISVLFVFLPNPMRMVR